MKMPGFTAEASLYENPSRHRSVFRFAENLGARSVMAQQFLRFPPWPTIKCCRYVVGHGLVCQTYSYNPLENCQCSNGVLICHGPILEQ
jgi:hypothetical protein